jgi:putative flippase GtrA
MSAAGAKTAAARRGRVMWDFLRDVRSTRWGVYGQGFRFALSGALVALVYATATTLLHEALGFPFELALAIGYVLSAVVHYTLQRIFVWRHAEQFALRAHRQLVRYLCVSGSQYGLTALATARLPGLLGVPVEAVYLVAIFSLAVINFVIFRTHVFHPDGAARVVEGQTGTAPAPHDAPPHCAVAAPLAGDAVEAPLVPTMRG